MIALLLLAAAPPASPLPASAIAAAPRPQSLQAQFDAASADADGGKCDSAIVAFEQLAGLPQVQRNPAVLASIKVRMGICLYSVDRFEEARQAIAAALPNLPDTPNFKADRFNGNFAMGRLLYNDIDYAGARPFFEAAMRNAAGEADEMTCHLWLARVLMFDSGPEAMIHADAALQMILKRPKPDKTRVGDIRTLRARVMLNRGEHANALKELRKSLTEQGGLTMKVSMSDLITRSDLAIAALLNKDQDSAREYLAFTGAGRFDDAFSRARSMEPPPCGGPADLKPEDSAVVEFSIDDKGRVIGPRPIWASRPGTAALEFARAVKEWSWAPADLGKISAFFRAVTRVELRCENGTSHPSILASLMSSVAAWQLPQSSANDVPDGPDAVTYPKLLAALESQAKSGNTLTRLVPLYRLAQNSVAEPAKRSEWMIQVVEIAKQNNAPAQVQAYFEIALAKLAAKKQSDLRIRLRALLAEPGFAGDSVIAATLRLLIAEPEYRLADVPDKADLLNAVIADTRLPERHPLRVAALLRLADVQSQAGNQEGARSAFERTGLDANQCALVAPTPALRANNAGSEDFPMEAGRWGFEGWVRFEADVTADGKTANQRAIIVYPPFVFRAAAEGIAKGLRFAKSYRPGGGTACKGYQGNVMFSIP